VANFAHQHHGQDRHQWHLTGFKDGFSFDGCATGNDSVRHIIKLICICVSLCHHSGQMEPPENDFHHGGAVEHSDLCNRTGPSISHLTFSSFIGRYWRGGVRSCGHFFNQCMVSPEITQYHDRDFSICSHSGSGRGGGVLGGFLAHRYGWQSVFGILAVPGLILALLSWFIPDYKTKVVNKEKHTDQVIKPRVKDTLLYIVKTPTLLYTFLAYSGFIMAIISFATWGSTFFVRTFNMNIEKAGMLIGLSALIQSGGAPLGGWLGDIMTRRICGGKLLVAAFAVLLFIALMSLSLQASAKGGEFNYRLSPLDCRCLY